IAVHCVVGILIAKLRDAVRDGHGRRASRIQTSCGHERRAVRVVAAECTARDLVVELTGDLRTKKDWRRLARNREQQSTHRQHPDVSLAHCLSSASRYEA